MAVARGVAAEKNQQRGATDLTTPWLIDVVAVSNTSLLAEWEEVYVAKAIYLAKATADDAVASRCSCMVPCSGCLLENLRAGTSYNVSLKVCNDYTCISSDDFVQETTVPGVPGPPTNVSVVLLSPTDVKIQWDPPEVTNGEIANYTALIFEPFLFKCSFRGSVNASCILYDLYEGVTYGVVVRACNHANRDGHGGGCGQPSPTLTFTTWTGYLDDDIMKKLTPHLGRLPELQETTQAMIILPLSVLRLNVSGPLLKASLVVHCGHMSLNPHYNGSLKNAFGDVTLFIDLTQEMENALLNPIGNTYRNNTNGSWEVVVINESSKALSSLPDKHFILGDGLGRPKISHLYNGPLYPDTPYTVQLRLYLQEAYFTSASMIFSTRASPVAPLIIFASFGAIGLLGLLGFCIYLARRRTDQYAMLVSEDRDGIQPVAVENFSDYVERLLESPNGHAYIHFRASLYENVYVDASYVTSCNYHQTGGFAIVPEFGNVPAFIAASTPMENTCLQFLTMVAQQCCPMIINLDE
ncbi:unnamed protein product [Schistocephalus solidus]|uniref:Fibronectin type-III domain-containing protein n=1 Tax=Schistocephalus solidus TaxID=70667 RepID=A0A183T332_SCHSO|nr:unnamed protein product [Schistocephalus solidus]